MLQQPYKSQNEQRMHISKTISIYGTVMYLVQTFAEEGKKGVHVHTHMYWYPVLVLHCSMHVHVHVHVCHVQCMYMYMFTRYVLSL
jgi:hypothetical protein